jgi:hypothetical protein
MLQALRAAMNDLGHPTTSPTMTGTKPFPRKRHRPALAASKETGFCLISRALPQVL